MAASRKQMSIGGCQMNDTRSLSHTSYRCKYHIVILSKYRRMIKNEV